MKLLQQNCAWQPLGSRNPVLLHPLRAFKPSDLPVIGPVAEAFKPSDVPVIGPAAEAFKASNVALAALHSCGF